MSSLSYFRNPVKLLPSENYCVNIGCFRPEFHFNSIITKNAIMVRLSIIKNLVVLLSHRFLFLEISSRCSCGYKTSYRLRLKVQYKNA